MYDLSPNPVQNSTSPARPAGKKSPLIPLLIIGALVVGFGFGLVFYGQIAPLAKDINLSLPQQSQTQSAGGGNGESAEYQPQTTQEEAVIRAVKDYSPAVVSIIITKDVPVYEEYYTRRTDPWGLWDFQVPQMRQNGTEEQEVGAGSGFIVSEDGMVVTNKHVVADKEAEYTAITVTGEKYPAQVLALDPAQDLAVLKIDAVGQKFSAVRLGDSSNLQIGQTVIAIGNTLGEFDNTVSVGVISGLKRSITAGGVGASETLENLIQTDAAINEGNSGGPLLNLKGEVIGVNTAIASNAQSVGFVLPINLIKRDIDQVKATGTITYPYLGIYYTTVDSAVQKNNNLPVNYGAWVTTTDYENPQSDVFPVVPGSPAKFAGLLDQDIVLEINGEKIDKDNPLSQVIAKYNPGDKVTLKVQRGNSQIELEVTFGDRSDYE